MVGRKRPNVAGSRGSTRRCKARTQWEDLPEEMQEKVMFNVATSGVKQAANVMLM